jgi:hypothetical protein
VENLFTTILEQKRRSSVTSEEESTEQPKTPKSETPITNMATETPMQVDNAMKGQELKLNQPKVFGGK